MPIALPPVRRAGFHPGRSLAVLCSLAATAIAAAGTCEPDLDGSGTVDGADLGLLIAQFGNQGGPADLDGSGLVDGGDLGLLLAAWGEPCVQAPQALQLAGRPLLAAPWIEFVQGFNAGTTVSLAVDVAQRPSLAGVTAAVYVTAARSAAEWGGDPSLTDVRGGPQSVLFSAGGVAANTFPLTGSAALAATDGDNLGRSYDLVVDVDGNGILGPGDLIDGGGDEPGFTVLPNLTLAGPHAVTQPADYTVTGPPTGFTKARLYYPSDIASLAPRPIVVISHGNGHQYSWYDYLGQHLASWGLVVISHQNNTSPGIETASTTTLLHTAALLQQQATIAAGVLNGHLDSSRIIWIGHSRGGEGVTRAYDRVFDGSYVPPAGTFTKDSIKLLVAIAPTDFLGKGAVGSGSDPHAVPWFLIYGGADGDVCGCPNSNIADSFNLLERSVGPHWSTYIHGADHNDFNCCGVNDFSGPAGTALGNAEVQKIAKVHILAAVKRVLDGSAAARELSWRQYGSQRPLGVLATATVRMDDAPLGAAGVKVIDDYQTQTSTSVSSSGGAVTFTVTNVKEAAENEADSVFNWVSSDSFNGATRSGTGDLQKAVVMDWTAAGTMEWAVPAALQDFSGSAFLHVRAAQQTRHPNTTAADSTFTVTLVDAGGHQASIQTGASSQGLGRPYQRTGYGSGAGWQNEMQAVRLRLTDFQLGGTGLDLTAITTVRFSFGGANGTATGRLIMDDLMITPE